ncbi:MAG: MotA/TolQ/ExbB proton channel family protein, partial [Bacteroidetes bacterium]|nr:MotA/TolQ/ExbB proton channel family protein [Bacteroidota bacterium]
MQFPLLAQVQDNAAAARQLLEQQAVTPPAVQPNTTTLWELIGYGGWGIMLPLALMSIAVVYITIERIIVLSKALKNDRDMLDRVRDYVHEGKIDSALNTCANSGTPGARMVEKGLQRIGKPLKDIESAMESVGELEMARLERGVGVLSLVAKLAPMFGFIG